MATPVNIPNILTYFRLGMVPLVAIVFALQWYVVALTLFFLAGFTDLIDGAIARRLNQRSERGAILDPIADKALMWVTFYCLASVREVPWWLFWLTVLKDLIVVGGIGYLKWRQAPFAYQPIIWSKVATLAQIVTGTLGLIDFTFPHRVFFAYPIYDFVVGGVYITAILIFITALDYVRKGLEIVQQRESG